MARQTVRPRSVPLLRELMKAKGYSLRDMERRGLGKSMVHALITDNDDPKVRKSTCSLDFATRYSEVLGVPVDVLFAPVASTRAGRPSVAKDGAAA